MNYIDLLLIIIVLLAFYSSIQKGFILAMVELLSWLGGLLSAFLIYPYVVSFIEKHISTGLWTITFSFLITLISIQIVLSYLSKHFLTHIPAYIHTTRTNKISGAFPGMFSGIIYAALATTLLLLLPVSQNLTNEIRESKIALKLSVVVEKMESEFTPVLDNVNRSISRLTIEPGSDRLIKLGFTVKNPALRPDLEDEMLRMVNDERIKTALNPLKADPELRTVARKHSIDMFARGYFSHISLEGATPFDRIRKAHVSFLTAGENLALAQTIGLAHKGLMNSPGHKANILNKSFGRVGIGIVDGGIYGIMVTQNFRN